ncbi:MAG: ATP-dependent DNA helicase DinG [Motiliproteus sp.]
MSQIPTELKEQIQQAYSKYLESRGLKARYGQKLMIAEIVKGLLETDQSPPISVVEAGTGTGKTIAYLLAAIPLAKHLGKKLVLSTATVALQEQIVLKDLPELLEHSGLSFDYALAKGRGRYLCLSKLDQALQNGDQNPNLALYDDELALQVEPKTLELYRSFADAYIKGTWDGERDSWLDELTSVEWSGVTTDHRQCSNRRCSNFSGCCFYKARQGLDQADCIVANHDLVMADLSLGGGAILPEPDETLYVFDEGHHLADKALSHFNHQLRLHSWRNWLKSLTKTGNRMLKELREPESLVRTLKPLESLVAGLLELLQRLDLPLQQMVAQIPDDDRNDDVRYVRFPDGVVPVEVLELAQQLEPRCRDLQLLLDSVTEKLKEAMAEPVHGIDQQLAERWFPTAGRLLARAEAARALWRGLVIKDKPGQPPHARWLSYHQSPEGEELELCCSPILAADTLNASLWQRCGAAVVTSATLTALGQFEQLKMRSGVPADSRFAIVPSPFHYAEAATLRLPQIKAAPNEVDAHDQQVAEELGRCLAPDQSALVLFTSWRQMFKVRELVKPALAERILAQGDSSKQQLLVQHKQRVDDGEGSVLFGLNSFAEGVDLPGDYLKHVVIAKIPFAVPGRPVEKALDEWIRGQGRDPFMEVAVPDASVRLIQASGRLLRSESDTGLITILDNRLTTRRYGRALLAALPPFKRELPVR